MDKQAVTRRELAEMLEKMIREVEAHASDYHHVTTPGLLAKARELLRRFVLRGPGGES